MARNPTVAPFVRCVSILSSKKYYLNNRNSFKHIISFVFTASEVGRAGVVATTRQRREVRILGGDMPGSEAPSRMRYCSGYDLCPWFQSPYLFLTHGISFVNTFLHYSFQQGLL